jgi:hypothetical protein
MPDAPRTWTRPNGSPLSSTPATRETSVVKVPKNGRLGSLEPGQAQVDKKKCYYGGQDAQTGDRA